MLRYFKAFLDYVRQQGIYIYRGDPAVPDQTVFSFTADGAWHELDLSAIVPEHTKAIDATFLIKNNQPGKACFFRRAGQANIFNSSSTYTQVGNCECSSDLTIPVDADRKLEYNFVAGGWLTLTFTVKGWWY